MLNNILLPIDFTANTTYAVKQAIELVLVNGSTIHLLHIVNENRNAKKGTADKSMTMPRDIIYHIKDSMKKLKEWKQAIEGTIAGTEVKIHLEEGQVHDTIINIAQKINAQLIILGRERKASFFSLTRPLSAEEISKLSGCPVLRVVHGANNTKVQNIVVPIRYFIPNRKIELLIIFSKLYRAKIHLVALEDRIWRGNGKETALLDTYQILKSKLTNRIEYHLLKGRNLPKTTLRYAESIGADMVFVNPEVETKLSMFTGKHINDLLEPKSKLKILYVEPYPAKYITNDN